MKILLVHNFYQQAGGEDSVFEAEGQLLEERGHEVLRFTAHNDAIQDMSRLQAARATLWNGDMYSKIAEVAAGFRPDVAHFHNTFPLISPAGYYAAREQGAAVVQTLHNFRLACANALFFREGKPCEDCLGRSFGWPAVRHSCYRGSRLGSFVTALMVNRHRARGTWQRAVDRYIVLTEFARERFVRAGLPEPKLAVKPNFVPDPGVGTHEGGYALFVGRLSVEKGVSTLLDAWRIVGESLPLKIAGDGPLAAEVGAASGSGGVAWVGARPKSEVQDLMRSAKVLVVPSICYEGCPMALVEAKASGLPVVASDLGAMGTMVEPRKTGLLFRAGDPQALAEAALEMDRDPELRRVCAEGARLDYLRAYSPDASYQSTLEIYEAALSEFKSKK